MAKVIEFYVRDFFPRTVRRTGSPPGQVIEFPPRLKQFPVICMCGRLSIEPSKRRIVRNRRFGERPPQPAMLKP